MPLSNTGWLLKILRAVSSFEAMIEEMGLVGKLDTRELGRAIVPLVTIAVPVAVPVAGDNEKLVTVPVAFVVALVND